MSKEFRPWKIDEAQLLPPSVQDYVPRDHLSRLIVALVREELDLSAISGSYRSVLGQPPFEHLAAAFDARFEPSGELGVLLGQGQFQRKLGLQDQAVVLDLDLCGGDRSLDW